MKKHKQKQKVFDVKVMIYESTDKRNTHRRGPGRGAQAVLFRIPELYTTLELAVLYTHRII